MNLTELSELEILQMQWDILEQLKQHKTPVVNNTPKEKITPKTEYKEGSFLKKLENAFKEKEPVKTKKRNSYPPEVLPNGIHLAQTHCTLYEEVWYAGGGRIKYKAGRGSRVLKLSVTQLLHMLKHFDDIPKRGTNHRDNWVESNYGVHIANADKIIWNLYRGTFNEIFEYYYQKNYTVNFDSNGTLILGDD